MFTRSDSMSFVFDLILGNVTRPNGVVLRQYVASLRKALSDWDEGTALIDSDVHHGIASIESGYAREGGQKRRSKVCLKFQSIFVTTSRTSAKAIPLINECTHPRTRATVRLASGQHNFWNLWRKAEAHFFYQIRNERYRRATALFETFSFFAIT